MAFPSLEQAKAHLNRSEINTDDAVIQQKLDAATAWVLEYIADEYRDEPPTPVVEAVFQLMAHWYQNREGVAVGVAAETLPLGIRTLLAPYRSWDIF